MLSTSSRPYKRSPFSRFAKWTSRAAGHPTAFGGAVIIILLWAISGPLFGFSDTWQLVINTGTTIVTFLMVFLIQHTQNRDSIATQLKLDEIIRSIEGAHNALLASEELNEDELDTIQRRYAKLAEEARENMRRGKRDTDTEDVNMN